VIVRLKSVPAVGPTAKAEQDKVGSGAVVVPVVPAVVVSVEVVAPGTFPINETLHPESVTSTLARSKNEEAADLLGFPACGINSGTPSILTQNSSDIVKVAVIF
jgi:hypothetical protein